MHSSVHLDIYIHIYTYIYVFEIKSKSIRGTESEYKHPFRFDRLEERLHSIIVIEMIPMGALVDKMLVTFFKRENHKKQNYKSTNIS